MLAPPVLYKCTDHFGGDLDLDASTSVLLKASFKYLSHLMGCTLKLYKQIFICSKFRTALLISTLHFQATANLRILYWF